MPLSKLNKEQYRAATAAMGHNLIIASAGTGKTSTIVARIAHLLNSGISADKILLLTFTNKAASEMIERLEKYFDGKIIKQIRAGTFHSVSNLLLKSLGKGVILKQPSELKTLLKSIADRRQFHRISDTKGYSGAYLYDIYSLFCNSCVNDESFEDYCYSVFGEGNSEKTIRKKLIDGFCMEVCMFTSSHSKLKDIEYYLLDDRGDAYHFLMKYKNRWYDAFNYTGVDKLEDLEFVHMYMSKYNEEQLQKYLTLVSKDDFDYSIIACGDTVVFGTKFLDNDTPTISIYVAKNYYECDLI